MIDQSGICSECGRDFSHYPGVRNCHCPDSNCPSACPPPARWPFRDDRVEAESVADFLERYYRPDRYHGRGEDYAAAVLASHEKHFEKHGYDIISRHESMTGKVVAYFATDEEITHG